MKKIKELCIKYKEFILYAVFGVLTTIANAGAFYIASHTIGTEYHVLNNAIAWIAGVVVAYVTNKLWVFESKSWKLKVISKEISEFVLARLLSFVFETVGLALLVKWLDYGDNFWGQFIIKLGLSVVVVLMNYIFSKFVIFRKKKIKKGEEATFDTGATTTTARASINKTNIESNNNKTQKKKE